MNKGIHKIFSQIYKTYEIVNHLLTFGLDIYWRKKCTEFVLKEGGKLYLDVCTGTGEMASKLANNGKNKKIIALDFCLPMLKKAKAKNPHINFVIGEAEKLPFKSGTFHAITISFATRNINVNKENLIRCFKEFRGALVKGGKFFNLETTQPEKKLGKLLFHFYVKKLVQPIGFFISGSEPAYKYLARTIPNFYDSEELKKILFEAGFSNVVYKKFFPGVVALHIAEK